MTKKYLTVPRKDFKYWFMASLKNGYSRKQAYKEVCKFFNIGYKIQLNNGAIK